jgi:hypothetical protein
MGLEGELSCDRLEAERSGIRMKGFSNFEDP